MEIGVCSDWNNLDKVKEAGFDYIEFPLNKLGTISDEEYKEVRDKLEKSGVKMKSCSLLLPKNMMALGPEYSEEKLDSYLDTAFSRMQELGGKIVVFGSGKSRHIPEGYNYQRAFKELVGVTKHIVFKAKEYGITIVIEPLNQDETDLINSLEAGAALSGLTGASLLADSFHMAKEGEKWNTILKCAPLSHAHIATLEGRCYPLELTDEVKGFIKALKDSGYEGSLSIEGKTDDIALDGRKAIAVIKKAYLEA